ncbi:hypothetical protein NW762_013666 [Fusarium torreyae]|uniref:Uncharacterized protein n=1 Tax=Fusarium torreyae TaxID=1237075 RepID=A0A9W8RLX8_9HYPO|nr:hypothetical protein NW762_013666 [Fusarium torreyae]
MFSANLHRFMHGLYRRAVEDLARLFAHEEQHFIFISRSKLGIFVDDARTHLRKNEEVIGQMPLQVYGSTLVFSQPGSLISQFFYDESLKPPHRMKSGRVNWDTLSAEGIFSTGVKARRHGTVLEDSPAPREFPPPPGRFGGSMTTFR